MVRYGLKHIFQKPVPDIDASDRTQQLRSKTIYAGTVDLAQNLKTSNSRYKTYNGPYEIVRIKGNSNLVASRSYDDLLSITKGKVLLNQLPLTPITQQYYQENFAKGQMYEANYNRFDPSFNFIIHTDCSNSVLVYDNAVSDFTNPPPSYDDHGGFIGATGSQDNNERIFIDPDHCYYSDHCLLSSSYTRFVSPELSGITGSAQFTAQQIISADQYRGFNYPMPNFNLTCVQPMPDQSIGPIFCPQPPVPITEVLWDYVNSPPTQLKGDFTPFYNGSAFTIKVRNIVPANAVYKITGISSVTNVNDPVAQVTLTGLEYFVGSIVSPKIRVQPAPFTATWEYTNDNGATYHNLSGNITPDYDDVTFTLRLKSVVPANATYISSGISSVKDDSDDPAQLMLTGTGNFTGVVTSPSIKVLPDPFSVTWEYTNDYGATYTNLSGSIIRPAYTGRPFKIRMKTIDPPHATYDISGNSTVTNVADGTARVIFIGNGDFVGTVKSPIIQVSPATFTAEWQYTDNNGQNYNNLTTDCSFNYNSSTYTISMKSVTPSYATFNTSGNSNVKNVADGTAQLTLTGTSNFTGSVPSPSITIKPETFSVVWKYTNDGNDGKPYDLSNNITPYFNNFPFEIIPLVSPSDATFDTSGNSTVLNFADPTAQVTLTGTGNFTGSVPSPSIQVSQATFTAAWHYTTDGQNYTDLTNDSSFTYNLSSTYFISIKSISPPYTPYDSFTQTGYSIVKNAYDPNAQLTLTGTGNFTGHVKSPSITIKPATFSVVWKYKNDGNDGKPYDLSNNITPYFNNFPFEIIPLVSPSDATFDTSGNSTILNVADPTAQVTLTGTGNFTGSVPSPSIQVSPATFTAEWQYTDNNGQTYPELTTDCSFNYNSSTYTISMKSVTPSYATFNTSGNSNVKNVADGTAQLTLTGTGNFTGSVPSPFIKVYPATFSVVWKYTNYTSIFDLSNNITPYFNNSSFNITPVVSSSDATFDTSGNKTVLNVGDSKAQLTLTGKGNFTGAFTSPSIQVSPATFNAEWQYTDNNGQNYNNLTTDCSFNYTSLTYAISMKSVTPSYASTYITLTGVSYIKNVYDPKAQLTLTGTDNFTGAVPSPSITVSPATFTPAWHYNNNGNTYDLGGNITPSFNNFSFNITYQLSPSDATFDTSGNSTILNVADPTAQVTLTGTGNFTGTIISPSIQVSPATFTAEWQYTNNNGQNYNNLTTDCSFNYNSLTYTISMKSVTPSHATFNTSGNSNVKNVADGTAQLTLTGTGNFKGSVPSPSIQVSPATFTATWHYTNSGNTYNLSNNVEVYYNGSSFEIQINTVNPPYAPYTTFTQTGKPSILNLNDGIAQLTVTAPASSNFIGSAESPTIAFAPNILNITGFTLNNNYFVSYVDSANNVSSNPTYDGYTIYKFNPTTTTTGTYSWTYPLQKDLSIYYLVVGGGGGGGGGSFSGGSGGGGAGGFLTNYPSGDAVSINPLTTYSLQVGGGGAGGGDGGQSGLHGENGTNSYIAIQNQTKTALGGGGGGGGGDGEGSGKDGGSGGGGGGWGAVGTTGQGFNGGNGNDRDNAGGGGGGASAAGIDGNLNGGGGNGGDGKQSNITGNSNPPVYYAGGGGGQSISGNTVGGLGGGAGGGNLNGAGGNSGTNGLGGGGGGGGIDYYVHVIPGGNGGSGIVIIRFPSFS